MWAFQKASFHARQVYLCPFLVFITRYTFDRHFLDGRAACGCMILLKCGRRTAE